MGRQQRLPHLFAQRPVGHEFEADLVDDLDPTDLADRRLGADERTERSAARGLELGTVVVTHPARARDKVRLRIPPADAHVFDAAGKSLPRRLDPATEALITDTNRPADPA